MELENSELAAHSQVSARLISPGEKTVVKIPSRKFPHLEWHIQFSAARFLALKEEPTLPAMQFRLFQETRFMPEQEIGSSKVALEVCFFFFLTFARDLVGQPLRFDENPYSQSP